MRISARKTGFFAGLARRFILLIGIILLSAGEITADQWVRISYVYDGDTVRTASSGKVRMAGIDAPEHDPEQYYYKESLQYLRSLVKSCGARVNVRLITKDRYGRYVAELFTPDGKSLCEMMLSAGMATFYYHDDLPSDIAKRLLSAQNRAIKKRAGMWRGLLASEPASKRYIGSKKSHRFFSTQCGVTVGRNNRVDFSSLEKAYAAGYSPARPCNIFPLVNEVR